MKPDWECPGVKLYCGDCLKILPHLPTVDAVITDPPYGVEGSKGTNSRLGKANYVSNYWEDTPQYIREVVVPIIQKLEALGVPMAVTPGNRNLMEYPTPKDIGCFWTPASVSQGSFGFSSFNPILYYGKHYKGARGPTGIRVTEQSLKTGHPCTKPLKAWSWLVEKVAPPKCWVLDPFMGSGTTGIACRRLGRNFIGIELEPAYFEIAKERIAKDWNIPLPGKPKQGLFS